MEAGKTYKNKGSNRVVKCLAINSLGTYSFVEFSDLGVSLIPSVCWKHWKEIKPTIKVECWFSVTSDGDIGGIYNSKEKAVNGAKFNNRAAIIHFIGEVEEGEGL